MYDIRDYYEACNINDAIHMLCEWPDAEIISGGTDVLIKVREGKMADSRLISIHRIEALKGIRMQEDGTIIIGAATSFSDITNHPIVQQYIPVLGEAVDQVGSPQIRNVGTIGGNICNGVTSADSASTLKAYNAILELYSPEGTRYLSIHEFYAGPGKTVRKHEEILVAVHIKKSDYSGFFGQYIKYGKRQAMEIATLGCACLICLSPDKKIIEDIRLAYGVAAPTPVRCIETENKLKGKQITQALITCLQEEVLKEVNPRTSWRASKEFRLQLIKELGKRACQEAICKAGGVIDA